MTEHKSSAEHVLDLLLYAPVGLLGEARSLLPELAEKGRVRIGNARMMGQLAVQFGHSEAERRLGQLEQQAKRSLTGYGLLPPDVSRRPVADGASATPPAPVAERPAPAKATSPRRPASRAASATTTKVAATRPAEVAALAIPDYDSLAASQVVSRLAGLSEAELAAVQRYELATRGRKTILGKIAQLQAS